MSASSSLSVPALARTGALGGALTLVSGVVVALVVGPASTVAPDRWSYPWTASGLVVASVTYAVLHLLVLAGLVGLARSGFAGAGEGRWGIVLAEVGLVLLAAAELASIPFADASNEEAGAVGALFGLANLVAAVGLVVAGIGTLRTGRWPGWGRGTVLVSGIVLLLVLPLPTVSAEALAIGVGAWSLTMTVFAAALASTTAPATRSATIEV